MTGVSAVTTAGIPARLAPPRALRGAGVAATAFVGLTFAVTAVIAAQVDPTAAFARRADGFGMFTAVSAATFTALGAVLTWYRPRSVLGWLALGVGVVQALSQVTYAYGFPGSTRDWSGWEFVVWLTGWVWVVAFPLMALLVLYFPDGRLPSYRWRPVAVLAGATALVIAVGWATTPYDRLDVSLDVAATNPVGNTLGPVLTVAGGVLLIATAVAAFAALAVRFRRSTGMERQQIKWMFVGAVATTVVLAIAIASGPTGTHLATLAMLPLPAAVAVAVLRYRLLDVDVVINRSLVFGVLSLAVLIAYVLIVAAFRWLIGDAAGAPVIAAAAVALGAVPARARIQRMVNRLLYGDRDDPYAAVTRVSQRLDAMHDGASVLGGVADAVRRALRVSGVVVEAYGEVRSRAGEPAATPTRIPLTYRGETIGVLRVGARGPGEQLSDDDLRLLRNLARQIAVAVHAERLTADLERSRTELIAAREEERRRIRRDLHDELGPTLAAVALEIERAAAGGEESADVLRDLPMRIRESVRTLRGLVENLRPAALDELGLAAAVREQARRLAAGRLAVEVKVADDLGVLPAAVDVAAYRIVSEALTNVAKHADASRCSVKIHRVDGTLLAHVIDDGRGLPAAPRRGLGLRSMRERAEELGGTFVVESSEIGGTVVIARLPVWEVDDD